MSIFNFVAELSVLTSIVLRAAMDSFLAIGLMLTIGIILLIDTV